jgi:hypothetical protein
MYRMSVTHRYKPLPYVIVRLTMMVIPGVGEVPETGISQRRSPLPPYDSGPVAPRPLFPIGVGAPLSALYRIDAFPGCRGGVPGRPNVGRASVTVVVGCYGQAGASVLASCLGWEVGAVGLGRPPGAPDGPGPAYCSAMSSEAG